MAKVRTNGMDKLSHPKPLTVSRSGLLSRTIAPRQRRKRTDTRVTVLEKRLSELQAVLDLQRPVQDDGGAAHVTASEIALAPPPGYRDENRAAIGAERCALEAEDENSFHDSRYQPSLERLFASGLLSTDTAIRLFNNFINNVLPQYPILTLSRAENFDWLRAHQPTLLLAIIAAACRASNPGLFRKLSVHLRGDLSEQVMVQGNKSIELVQAILVMAEWYDVPEDLRRLNFYAWIQTAGLMVRELGLWPWSEDTNPSVDRTMAQWRISFATYLPLSTAAVSLRRPMPLVWTESTRNGVDVFEKNSVLDNDKRLVAWVRLQMMAEEVEALRVKAALAAKVQGEADPSGLVDQHTLSSLESRFSRWRDDSQLVFNGSLRMHFFYCRIKFYELAVTCSPFRSASHPKSQPPSLAVAGDMTYVRTIMSLIQSSHSALDTLVLFDTATYRCCPTVVSVRALYALQELFTIWKAVRSRQGYLSEFVTEEVLALKFYARQTEDFFKQVVGPEGFGVPRMALKTLPNLLFSLDDIKNHERQRQVQQPERLSQDNSPRATADSPSPSANDLEVILIIDLGEIQAPSASQRRDQVQDDTRMDAALEWPAMEPAPDDFNVTLEDALLAPELGTLMAPDSVLDPGWLFS
ncbi:hypothetical protein MKX08_001068 [Trichoderma sp. CBMAI-0020]|nr:hypothetical protein MKX08_001068 [Trichoderma sp. CBMAI-0020]